MAENLQAVLVAALALGKVLVGPVSGVNYAILISVINVL